METIRSSIGGTSQVSNRLTHGLPVSTQVSPRIDKLYFLSLKMFEKVIPKVTLSLGSSLDSLNFSFIPDSTGTKLEIGRNWVPLDETRYQFTNNIGTLNETGYQFTKYL